MKKLLFIFALSISLMACEKEESLSSTCNCGDIIEKDYKMEANGLPAEYFLIVTNHCTGNDKRFELLRSEYELYQKGDVFCHNSIQQW